MENSYDIDTSSVIDDSKPPIFYNYYCKACYWEFSNTNIPNA